MRQTIFVLLLKIAIIHSFHLDHSLFLEEDDVPLERHVRDDKVQQCDEDKLIGFLAEIQVINPESVAKLATLNQIETSCVKVAGNLEKVRNYLKTCQPPNQPDLYMQLIKGVESLYEKICTESAFKRKFEPIHHCIHELKNDFEACGGPPDWNENSDSTAVCKAYKSIVDCYYIKTAKVCGKEAAGILKELLEAIVNSIITVDCSNVKTNPEVSDAMPDVYIKKSNANANRLGGRIVAAIVAYYIITRYVLD